MVEKIEKGDVVTRFWYTLKNLHPRKKMLHFMFITFGNLQETN
jgi:hypothetical protein